MGQEIQKNILVLLGQSRYEVLRKAAIYTAKGFEAGGTKVTIIDTTTPNFNDKILFDNKYDLIFMNQAFLFGLVDSNRCELLSKIKSKVCGWIFDDVLFHYGRVLANHYDNVTLLSVDGAADAVMKKMKPGLNQIYTMLHGGFVAKRKYEVKEIDVLCPCTLGKEPAWKAEPTKFEIELAKAAIDLWCSNPKISARTAIGAILNEYGETFDGGVLAGLSNVVLYVMDYTRYLCRRQIVLSLANEGLNIHLIGKQESDEQYPENVTVHGPMEIDDVVELFAKSRVVINPFPCVYEKGAHERIFTALLNHAVVFTPEYDFLRELFGERIEYIDLNDMSDAIERIHEIINNFKNYKDAIEDNYQYAINEHTWEHRGKEILEFINL